MHVSNGYKTIYEEKLAQNWKIARLNTHTFLFLLLFRLISATFVSKWASYQD